MRWPVSSEKPASAARCSGPTPPSVTGSSRSATTSSPAAAEAEREGWLGEVEGLQVSLAGAEDELAQLHAEQSRRGTAIDLGMPTFAQIAIRASDVKEPAP
jgi:hypothetical protein